MSSPSLADADRLRLPTLLVEILREHQVYAEVLGAFGRRLPFVDPVNFGASPLELDSRSEAGIFLRKRRRILLAGRLQLRSDRGVSG